MVEKIGNKIGLPICKKCGMTVPPGKELCWCCEHAPKLNPASKQSCDSKDTCELHMEVAQ